MLLSTSTIHQKSTPITSPVPPLIYETISQTRKPARRSFREIFMELIKYVHSPCRLSFSSLVYIWMQLMVFNGKHYCTCFYSYPRSALRKILNLISNFSSRQNKWDKLAIREEIFSWYYVSLRPSIYCIDIARQLNEKKRRVKC
jgi:hypothetical protein